MTPRRHPTALPSPAADIAGRGHMPHRLPVQPTLPSSHHPPRSITGVAAHIRYHHAHFRSRFHPPADTPLVLHHSSPTPEVFHLKQLADLSSRRDTPARH